MLQLFEQHRPIDICQSDHHCKRFARQKQDGTQLLTNRFIVMNTWGGLPIAVCTETTPYSDEILANAFDQYHEAAQTHGHPAPIRAILDNPRNDGAGVKANLWPGKLLQFSSTIHNVDSEER